MPFQPAPDTAQVQLIMKAGGMNAQNTLYFRKEGGWDVAALSALAESVATNWATRLQGYTSADWGVTEVVATDISSVTGGRGSFIPDPALAGTAVGGSVPGNATFAIKFGVPRRGKGLSGRVFQIGMDEENVSAGFLTSTYADQLVQGWNLMMADVETDTGAEHVVVHRTIGGVKPPTAEVEHVSSYGYADLAVDSQKLRLPNHRKAKRRTP